MSNIFVNGVTLSTDAWYMRLLKWCYGTKPSDFKSLCPLFWSVMGTIILLPIVALLKGIFRFSLTKCGRKIMKAGEIIFKWFILCYLTFAVTLVMLSLVNQMLISFVYGYDKENSFMILAVVLFVLILFGVLSAVIWFAADWAAEYQCYPDSEKSKRIKKALKPFNLFGLFIKASFHKVCPLIHWTSSKK